MNNLQKSSQRQFQILQILATISVVWVYMGGPVYLRFNYPQTPPPVVSAAFMLIVVGVFFVVSKRFEIAVGSQQTQWLPIDFFHARLGLVIWLLLFILLAWFSLSLHGSNIFSTEDLNRRISSSVFLCALLVLLTDKNVRHTVSLGIVFGSIALGLSICMASLKIGFLTSGVDRIGGLYVNANEAAYALVCGLWFGSRIIESSRWRNTFQIIILMAVLITMSRSGIIALLIMMIVLAYQKKVETLKLVSYFSIFVLLALAALWYRGELHSSSMTFKNLKGRVEIEFNDQSETQKIRLSGAAGERAQLAQDSIDRFKENIWLGAGIESTKGEQSHNEFLSFISKHGVLGGILFIAFWFVFLQAGLPAGLAMALFIMTMFDHSFFYNRFILLTLACSLDFKGWHFLRHRKTVHPNGSNNSCRPTTQTRSNSL